MGQLSLILADFGMSGHSLKSATEHLFVVFLCKTKDYCCEFWFFVMKRREQEEKRICGQGISVDSGNPLLN